MVLRTKWNNQIRTPIPATTQSEEVLNILHDHGFLITLQPLVTRYEEAARDGDRITYDVCENIDLLPGWKREVKFQVSFADTAVGVDSWVQAPMGLSSQAVYVVAKEQGAGWTLEESIESECSVFLKSFVESTMVSARKKMHLTIIEKATERGA